MNKWRPFWIFKMKNFKMNTHLYLFLEKRFWYSVFTKLLLMWFWSLNVIAAVFKFPNFNLNPIIERYNIIVFTKVFLNCYNYIFTKRFIMFIEIYNCRLFLCIFISHLNAWSSPLLHDFCILWPLTLINIQKLKVTVMSPTCTHGIVCHDQHCICNVVLNKYVHILKLVDSDEWWNVCIFVPLCIHDI